MRKADTFSLWNIRNLKKMMMIQILLWGISLFPFHHLSPAVSYGIHIAGAAAALLIFAFYDLCILQPSQRLGEMLLTFEKSEVRETEEAFSEKADMTETIGRIIHSIGSISLKQKNAEILMKNAEINNLQDQINPHFLYNTLEVIRGEALMKGQRKIADMTAALSSYFRYNISRKDVFVHLEDELKNSMNYFSIQKSRFQDKISCEIQYLDVKPEDVSLLYIPKLILQPVIENAIYHGLELKIGPGKIVIMISADEKMLRICVEDDGLGMTAEKLAEINGNGEIRTQEGQSHHNSVALNNIRERLKLYWGDQAYLYAESQLNVGTRFHLCMPRMEKPPAAEGFGEA